MNIIIIIVLAYACFIRAENVVKYDLRKDTKTPVDSFVTGQCAAMEICADSGPTKFLTFIPGGTHTCTASSSESQFFGQFKCNNGKCVREIIDSKMYTLPVLMCMGLDKQHHWRNDMNQMYLKTETNATVYVITGAGDDCSVYLKRSYCPVITEFKFLRVEFQVVSTSSFPKEPDFPRYPINFDRLISDGIAKKIGGFGMSWIERNLVDSNHEQYELIMILPLFVAKRVEKTIANDLRGMEIKLFREKAVIQSAEWTDYQLPLSSRSYGSSGWKIFVIVVGCMVTVGLIGFGGVVVYHKRRTGQIRL